MLLSQVLPLVGMALFLTIPRQLSQFFLTNNDDAEEILQTTSRLLIINGIGQLFDGLRQTITGALIGQNDNFFPMATNVVSMCFIGILSSYLIGFVGNQGIDGIFAGRSICMFLAVVILGIRWFKMSQTCIELRLTKSTEDLLGDRDEITHSQQSTHEIDTTSASSSITFFQRTSPLIRSNSFSDCQNNPMQNKNISIGASI